MPATLSLISACVVAFYLTTRKLNPFLSVLLSSCIVPVFILVAEVVSQNESGGASMWPIALIFGSCYGIVASSCGALSAVIYKKFIKNT